MEHGTGIERRVARLPAMPCATTTRRRAIDERGGRLSKYAQADDLHPDERTTLLEAAAALEAAREAAAYMRNQVEWEPCDCGCPAARTPKDARAVTWLRAAAMVNRAISGRRDE